MTTGLTIAAPAAPEVSTADRTIRGLAVPFGPVGRTSAGALTFSRGSLRWVDPKRVKLLVEHDQRLSVGYATELEETDAGVLATFYVPPGEAGDRALEEARSGVRDALSVGVQLDDAVVAKLRKALAGGGGAVAGAGALRETSLVSVPAFDDARVAAQSGELVISAWHDLDSHEGQNMTTPATVTDPSTTEPATPATAAASTPAPAPAPSPAPAATPAPTSAPAPVLAAAGAALLTVSSEPSTYSFDGRGPSLVRDAFHARFSADHEAAERLARYNAELAGGNPASSMALAAVLTRDAVDQIGPFVPQGYRGDMLVRVIDGGRPIVSRLNRTPITNASPFLLPVEGEFDGVGEHTEGTAHVPEGTLEIADEVVRPKAYSGAFRVSRELVDSSNPAIDRVAANAMLRDYRRVTEGVAWAAIAAADAVADLNVDTVAELRAALLGFLPDDDVPASFVAMGRTFTTAILLDDDTTGRPILVPVGATTEGVGSRKVGAAGTVDGVELFRASQVPAAEAAIVAADDVLWAESNVQQFRFDEVEGPGIVKLALWAYAAAAVLRPSGVQRLTTAAA